MPQASQTPEDLAGRAATALQRKVARYGVDIGLYTGAGLPPIPVRCFTEPISDGKSGISFLGRQGLAAYAAQADSRVFFLAAPDFAAPDVGPPIPTPRTGGIIVYGGRGYHVSNAPVDASAGVPVLISAAAFRVLMSPDASLSPVFDAEAAQLWRPGNLRGRTDPISLDVKDVGENIVGTVQAFWVPLDVQEKLTLFGTLDIRVNTLYTEDAPQGYLLLGDVLYRPAIRECWVVVGASERQPGSGLVRSQVKHLEVAPPQVRAANP